MLVPLSWIAEYVELDISPKELAAKLTASGTSVERMIEIGQGLDDLIVAEVLNVSPHPNADRLRLATVNTGQEKLQIVCGAANLAAGQKIVFAPVGARVPVNMHDDERKPFTLTQATIRGVDSQGMICSSAEMGLGSEHAGILVLDPEAKVGQKVSKALGYPQIVFDTEVTTNRNDELSMIGIAREVAVLTNKPLKTPAVKAVTFDGSDSNIKVSIDSKACIRLMAQAFSVKVGPSPEWLQQRLSLYGMRPINNVVDITNYVMLEYGQPLHGYDMAKLHTQTLQARQARAGETMTTLDGVERRLSADMLVITDTKEIVGVAGIMGGEASKTDEQTEAIILEAAVFDPVVIRKAANALALRSEASKRFERGVDATTTSIALQRAAQLLVEYAEATPLSETIDAYPQPQKAQEFSVSQQKLNQYLGKEFALSKAQKILQALGFEPITTTDESLTVSVPSWRARDIDGQEDLIEEVVRMVGYGSLPVSLPVGTIPNQLINSHYASRWQTKQLLTQAGWWEVVTNSLTDPLADGVEPGVAIANPLSSEWTHLRQSLLPGLLSVARSNIRQRPDISLFELSNVYTPSKGLPSEQQTLAMLMTGDSLEQNLMELKGVLHMVANRLGLNEEKISYQDSKKGPWYAPTAALVYIEGQQAGLIGQLSPSAYKKYDLPATTLVLEVVIEPWLQQPRSQSFLALPKFPAVEEDISLLVDEDVAVGSLIESMRKASSLVESVSVSDIYRHTSLGVGKTSPLLHITYRSMDHTLNTEEVTAARSSIMKALHKQGVTIRE